jgi:hypothetical protein
MGMCWSVHERGNDSGGQEMCADGDSLWAVDVDLLRRFPRSFEFKITHILNFLQADWESSNILWKRWVVYSHSLVKIEIY